MNASNVKLSGFLLVFLVLPAHAINKSTVINETDKAIAVVWTALGCLHTRFDHGEVCASVILAPGQDHKYQYNWGATNDHIHAGGFVEKRSKYLVPGSIPSPYSTTVKGNCKLASPDGRVVHITSMTIDGDKMIIDCEYDIRNPPVDIDSFEVPEADGYDSGYESDKQG